MLPKISSGVIENFGDNLGPGKAAKLIKILKEEDPEFFKELELTCSKMATYVSGHKKRSEIKQNAFVNFLYLAAAVRYVINHQIEADELEKIYG
jgi:hypothetical protein